MKIPVYQDNENKDDDNLCFKSYFDFLDHYMGKLNVCDGRFATAPLIYAGSCPKPEFGRFMLENVRNSGVENVRRCRTSSKPKKVQI